MSKPDSRIPVKDIYEDFRAWVVAKHGSAAWNNIGQRQVYIALKNFPQYAYIRYSEGYCLKGIAYKPPKTSDPPNKEDKKEISDVDEEEIPLIQAIQPIKLENTSSSEIHNQPHTMLTLAVIPEVKAKPIVPRFPQIIIPTIGRHGDLKK